MALPGLEGEGRGTFSIAYILYVYTPEKGGGEGGDQTRGMRVREGDFFSICQTCVIVALRRPSRE